MARAAAGAEVAVRMVATLSQDASPPASYAELMERLATALFRHLLQDPLYRQLRLMEASAPTPVTDAFREARGKVLTDWLAGLRGSLAPPG